MAYPDFPVHIFDPEAEEESPIGFSIGGEKFPCIPRLPVGAIWFLSDGNVYGTSYILFISSCLTPGQEDRFNEIISSKTRIVPREMLEQIVHSLWEQYLPFESGAPGSSLAGLSTTGDTSKVVSSPAAAAPNSSH